MAYCLIVACWNKFIITRWLSIEFFFPLYDTYILFIFIYLSISLLLCLKIDLVSHSVYICIYVCMYSLGNSTSNLNIAKTEFAYAYTVQLFLLYICIKKQFSRQMYDIVFYIMLPSWQELQNTQTASLLRGKIPTPATSVLDMTLNNLMMKFL